jgi:hypothetical protein
VEHETYSKRREAPTVNSHGRKAVGITTHKWRGPKGRQYLCSTPKRLPALRAYQFLNLSVPRRYGLVTFEAYKLTRSIVDEFPAKVVDCDDEQREREHCRRQFEAENDMEIVRGSRAGDRVRGSRKTRETRQLFERKPSTPHRTHRLIEVPRHPRSNS